MLDLLLPQRCLGCGRSGAAVCRACIEALQRLAPPLCERCGAPTAWPVRRCGDCSGRRLAFASARAAVAYDERVRVIVSGWKEHGLRRLAATAADVVVAALERPSVDALTFVPPARERLLVRGHHPAERLALELCERWQLPIVDVLKRRREAPPQRGSSLAERRRNARGLFEAHAPPKCVCVIDDVYTSGATASAAASAVRKAGARTVTVVTFARALRLR
jgi:predicted amidophosphoribosyltransferase